EVDFFYKPIDTLYQIDKKGHVIYINTFTKSIAPGFRVAYMVLPDSLLTVYKEKLSFFSCPVPVFIQYVLAGYISDGQFERHLAKMRRKIINQN
ncbi:MAG: aminotransferase class I/II-fold pyridoxal phosphate-dependent enzyme, partial [Lachnospiraceae bacterium]|nr:aminotransferase class I/II-fold pyridoxal phosphate-dependent enzyme [Lachnospiraceae bacterium]